MYSIQLVLPDSITNLNYEDKTDIEEHFYSWMQMVVNMYKSMYSGDNFREDYFKNFKHVISFDSIRCLIITYNSTTKFMIKGNFDIEELITINNNIYRMFDLI
jgi:hypothetical protein